MPRIIDGLLSMADGWCLRRAACSLSLVDDASADIDDLAMCFSLSIYGIADFSADFIPSKYPFRV